MKDKKKSKGYIVVGSASLNHNRYDILPYARRNEAHKAYKVFKNYWEAWAAKCKSEGKTWTKTWHWRGRDGTD